MAETAVNFVIDKLIPVLMNEARLQKGMRAQVQGIRDDLDIIQSYLRDADINAEREEFHNKHAVKVWVKKVREVTHRIEDVIDEYRFQVAKRGHQRQRGIGGFVRKVGGFVSSIKPSHEILSDIEDIKKTIATLKDRRETFGSGLGEGEGVGPNSPGPNISSLPGLKDHMDDSQLAGINKSPRDTLVSFLLHDTPVCKIIPVVGLGGLGKTTLVRKVYDNEDVRRTFKCRAWVDVTQSSKVEDVLKKLIKEFQKNSKFGLDADKEQLINEAKGYLEGKRYLVVFDNVSEVNFWQRIKHALPSNKKGSSIIITTRKQEVIKFCNHWLLDATKVEPYYMKTLSHSDAMELFYQKAFYGGICPDELKGLSNDIVKKCNRMPLHIVAIGSLLSTKNNIVTEWEKVHDRLSSSSRNDPILKGFDAILFESYHDLPYHLKLCFLYFGVFPEDYSISCKRVVRHWIAEGFIDENTDFMEDVGMNYLEELIKRGLVQVSRVGFDGKIRNCRVHHMMRGFILKKCKELNFCEVLSPKQSGLSLSSSPRRLSLLENDDEKEIFEGASNRKVRSCFVFSVKGVSKSFISTFRLLITLDFEDSPLDVLPKEVGDLMLLRYLSIRNTKIKTLPKSIGKLQNLLILNLKNSQVKKLPLEINKLKKLRRLLGYSFHEDVNLGIDSFEGLKLRKGFRNLNLLEKLSSIDISKGANSIIKELRELKNLKKLGVKKLKTQNGRLLCSAIEILTSLRTLSVGSLDDNEFLELEYLTHPPENLQRLYLEGRLKRLPEWVCNLKNLVRLHLNWSGLLYDPLVALKDLPELLDLGLHEAYSGGELHFKEGWLKKLKILRLRNLRQLKTLKIDEGALIQLEKLHIGPCPQMTDVPNDIRNLSKLKTLCFYEMPLEFKHSMEPTQQNHVKIQHVPNVLFFNRGTRNTYIKDSLHYKDINENNSGEDYENDTFFDFPDADESPVVGRTGKSHPLDSWYWVIPFSLSLLVAILAFLSKFLDRASSWR